MSKLVELRERYAAKLKEHGDFYAQYPERDWADDKDAEVEARTKEIDGLFDDIQKLMGREAGAAKAAQHDRFANEPVGAIQHAGGPTKADHGGLVPVRGRLSDMILGDPAFKEWYDRHARDGVVSSKVQINSPAVELKDLLKFRGVKSLVTGADATSGGALVFPDVQAGYVQLPFRPLTLRDIITVGQTGSDTVEYARVTSYTSRAAATPEATAVDDDNAIKPESDMALEKVTAPVRTIANTMPATKRSIADAGQLRTIIDNFLMDSLEQAIEDEIMTGDNSGEHFDGLGHMVGIQSQAFDTDLLTTTRKARTLVRVVGRDRPNAFLVNPYDWETIDLLQDNEARYYNGGPREILQPRLWGLPVVETEACPEGLAYVGNFKQCILWDREMANTQFTDSHADYFVRNMVMFLTELRVAFGILRPASVVEISLS